MIDINLGKGRSVSIDQFARTMVKESIRTQLMLKSTLIRLEELKTSSSGVDFHLQQVEALLNRIDEKTELEYDAMVNKMTRR